MKKKSLIKFGMFFLIGIFLISFISAQVSYCCEKTTYGAWCQNEEQDKCDSAFKSAPTSCEATSYCRQGCCYNSQEGTCMENTPQIVCEEKGGVWDADANCDIPQCELGCCLIGSQAAFVTQTRCKRLSNLYGLENNFRTDIENEALCVLSATSDVEGACVFIEDFETTCKRTTQKECNKLKLSSDEESSVEFYSGKLCTDETLGTNCAPTEKTTCVPEKDGVYFLDSCGNIANIYDSSKIDNQNYWSEIKDVAESCGYDESNANSRTCGNCDYYLGTTCKQFQRGTDSGAPRYGDYICRDLGCSYQGNRYEHGESFCAVVADGKLILGKDDDFNEDDLAEKNQPGSRYFRLLCYNGDIITEPCADFRTEVCIQDEINGFLVGACRANRWKDCASQDGKKDCENQEKRDCKWVDFKDDELLKGCVPKYAPGYSFWEKSSTACSKADFKCTIEYEKGILGFDWDDEDCEKYCECADSSWKNKANKVCSYFGDCGAKQNFIGKDGYFDVNDLFEEGDIKKT